MGRPTTSLSLRLGPNLWEDPVGLHPPSPKKKTQTVRAWDVCGVRAFRTTTGLVVLGQILLLNIRDMGKVVRPSISKEKGCKKRT